MWDFIKHMNQHQTRAPETKLSQPQTNDSILQSNITNRHGLVSIQATLGLESVCSNQGSRNSVGSRGPDPGLEVKVCQQTPMPLALSRGADPGSEVKVCQQTPMPLALSAVTCLRKPKSHPKQYGRVLEPGFRTLRERE